MSKEFELSSLFDSVEITTEKAHTQDLNEDIEFGENSTQFHKCPHCGTKEEYTQVDYESSWITWVIVFLIWIIFGWMTFFILPVIWPAIQDVVHSCPRCLNVVARRGRIHKPIIQDDIVTIQVGTCAVVVSKKYIAGGLFIVGFILSVFLIRSIGAQPTLLEYSEPGPTLTGHIGTWDRFQEGCSIKKSFGNPIRALRIFDDHYKGNTVQWEGRVMGVKEGSEFMLWKTPGLIYIDMIRSESDTADCVLAFDPQTQSDMIATIERNDYVRFIGTCAHMGRRGNPHHLQVWAIQKIPERREEVFMDNTPHILQMLLGGEGLIAHGGSHPRVVRVTRGPNVQETIIEEGDSNVQEKKSEKNLIKEKKSEEKEPENIITINKKEKKNDEEENNDDSGIDKEAILKSLLKEKEETAKEKEKLENEGIKDSAHAPHINNNDDLRKKDSDHAPHINNEQKDSVHAPHEQQKATTATA